MDEKIISSGIEIFELANKASSKRSAILRASDSLMEWTMKHEELKISLLRFIDVLPNLESSSAVIRVAREYFPQDIAKTIPGFKYALSVPANSPLAYIGAKAVRYQVRAVAKQFILGETPAQSLKSLINLRERGFGFTIDLLGEETLSEAEALEYQDRYLDLINQISNTPFPSTDLQDPYPLNISVKLSALYSQYTAESFENSLEVFLDRLLPILTLAQEKNVCVFLDMEDTSYTDLIIEAYKRVLSSGFGNTGLVLQAYLTRTREDLTSLIDWAKSNGQKTVIRLVKGAYWDTETIDAKEKGWEIPVWQIKENSDQEYEALSKILLDNIEYCYPAFGSHNIRSLCYATCYADSLNIPRDKFELQALYGMAEGIKSAFVQKGYFVREYAPIGELLPGMSYLVRRLLENTSNESFLRQGFHEDETPESLLKAPTYQDETELREQSTDSFKNLPPLDFSIPSQRALITAELENFKTKNICPVIDGKDIQTTHIVKNLSPENPENVISNAHYANTEHAEKSIKSLSKGFQHWSNESLRNRAQILIKVAALMTKRRAYFTALLIREASKQWVDADAEVCEAIDFLNYYALQAESLSEGSKLSDTPGENNTLKYVPRGLSLVIGPWNFPLAIPCGMMSANLVCGNPTILKPAEQTSRIASEMFNLFLECGLPADCSAFLPGKGEEIGKYLSEHPNISTITFTGSRAVGTMLIKSAGNLFSKSKNGKKVVAEMGGKNAIIVDETADPDEAVKGIIKSAFGFQGQKCSACSRLLVQESIYESFLSRLAEAIKSIKVGPATEPYNKVGAVIDTEARDRISGYIERAQAELKIVAQSEGPGGSYISPVAFRDVPTEHPLMQEEVFGPVLAICAFDTIKTAVNIANSTDYSLTGGIYSRSPANIQYCIDHVDVGNFYINRNCTGAMVERHPFGGFNQSGIGFKTGGPSYLLQFMNQKAISENTMRRGFAPDSY